MEYIMIFNGLGNQMSQYALFLSKRKRNPNCRLYIIDNPREHNGYELERIFGVKQEPIFIDKVAEYIFRHIYNRPKTRFVSWLLGFRMRIEPRNYDYSDNLHAHHRYGINFYRGGWHSEKNFLDAENEVRKAFTFPKQEDSEYNTFLMQLRKDDNSVSVHIRRGDYVNIPKESFYQFGGVATDEYYMKAVKYIKDHVDSPRFYVFSNDIEWCKNHLGIQDAIYVTGNTGPNSWRDLQLMTECKHHIIANSSFSWWGAWLSRHEKLCITIRPKWFVRDVETNDIYPDHWVEV